MRNDAKSVFKLQLIADNFDVIFSMNLKTSTPAILWNLLRLTYIMILGVKMNNKVKKKV